MENTSFFSLETMSTEANKLARPLPESWRNDLASNARLFFFSTKTRAISTRPQTTCRGTDALKDADLAFVFLRFRNLPDDQMQPIVDYIERGGPVIGLRTSTHAFQIPKNSTFAKYDHQYKGDEYVKGFGRQVLGETWAGHYGKNHVMSTRLDIVDSQKDHPILRGVKDPWTQAGGYWTDPIARQRRACDDSAT